MGPCRGIAAAVCCLTVLSCGRGPNSSAAYVQAGVPTVMPAPPATAVSHFAGPALPAAPPFRVVAERPDRPDKATTYYVVIDPVDRNTEDFKQRVRSVLRGLAAANGGPVFSAYLWDREAAALTEVSYKSQPDLFSEEQFTSKDLANERHFVASYEGGRQYAGEPPAYLIFWFPSSSIESPDVGRWVSAEVWEPR